MTCGTRSSLQFSIAHAQSSLTVARSRSRGGCWPRNDSAATRAGSGCAASTGRASVCLESFSPRAFDRDRQMGVTRLRQSQ